MKSAFYSRHEWNMYDVNLCFRNPGFKTIEEDLLKAFKEADVISEEWYSNPQKGFFQRASRTDKGVSAARMIISLKMGKFYVDLLSLVYEKFVMENKKVSQIKSPS